MGARIAGISILCGPIEKLMCVDKVFAAVVWPGKLEYYGEMCMRFYACLHANDTSDLLTHPSGAHQEGFAT